jgi:SAM-dependent methyltransferase
MVEDHIEVSSAQAGIAPESYTLWGNQQADAHNAIRTASQQAAFFVPHLHSDMRLLDCGCGPGTITVGLAEIVAPGEVVGIDVDEAALEQAQTAQKDRANVHFEYGNLYSLPFPNSTFDAVFSHAVLEHLGEPANALSEMYRILKPGGVIGIRLPDWDGLLLAPPDPLLHQTFELVERFRKQNGGDMRRGKHLPSLLRQAGFTRVYTSASYECHGTVESTRSFISRWQIPGAGPVTEEQWIRLGLADRETLERMRDAWKQWAESPDAFLARPFCEAVAWKA